MPVTFEIHPDVVSDISAIALFLNAREPGLGDDFVIAVDDTLDTLEREMNRQVIKGPRYGPYLIREIIGLKSSPSYAKKFSKYSIWFEWEEEAQRVYLYMVAFSGRDRVKIGKIIKRRIGPS